MKEDDELGNNSLIENLSSGSSSEEGRNYLIKLYFSFSLLRIHHKNYFLHNYPWEDDSDPEESIEYLEDCHNFDQSPSEDGSFGSESVGDTLSESGLKLNKI